MANNDKHTLAGDMPGNVVFGIQGESAYQVAVRNGFEGTEEEWLKSLSGPAGVSITDMYDLTASQSAAGTQSLAGKKHTLTVKLSNGTERSFPFKDGDNGQRGRGVYPWDLNASSSFVDDEGTTHYRDGVTLPDGVVLLDGDLLLTGTGDVYRVEQWNNIYGMTVKHLYNIAGSAPGSGGNANQGTGWTAEQINLLDQLFNYIPWTASGAGAIADSLIASLRGGESGEEEPDEPVVPDEPEVTLTSISAVYSGGDVAVGTAVTALTGIVVTAHYSDGTSEAVTGYTLSGTIAEGSNTVTVSYGGKTATFSVTGVAESAGGDTGEEKTLTMTKHTESIAKASFYEGDADSTLLTAWNGYWYKADAIADEDTVVRIAFAAGGNNSGISYYAAQIKQEDFMNFFYVEKLGTATTAETIKEYTVHAGHELVFIVSNSSDIGTLNVTYTEGSFTAPSELYTNLVEGFTVDAYLKSSDGTVTDPWGQQNTSDLINVSGISSVHIWHINGNGVLEQYALTYCFYDESETFISGGTSPAHTEAITPVAVPENAKYMRVGGAKTNTNSGVYAGVNPAPYHYEFVAFK